MGWISTLASVGMAVGPPLAYADQFESIRRSHNSAGFSIDISGLLIVANVSRVFYWLGERFQTALLIQSFLMILAQFALLYICLLYRDTSGSSVDPRSNQEAEALTGANKPTRMSTRPGNLWQWRSFGSYVEFVALLILLHCSLYLILHSFQFYITGLGFLALGLEATLPIPQLLVNFERKSTAGFRRTVLAAWVGGDAVKTIYFFLTPDNSISFKACAIFQLSVDLCICAQTWIYRAKTKRDEESRVHFFVETLFVVAGADWLQLRRLIEPLVLPDLVRWWILLEVRWKRKGRSMAIKECSTSGDLIYLGHTSSFSRLSTLFVEIGTDGACGSLYCTKRDWIPMDWRRLEICESSRDHDLSRME
ncbi:hypothetical protein T439DRAFT_291721 [Meredithblackwellia eburnea MCA 4105]